jgi:peptide/nickel transport system substrate-binding protein
MEVYKSDAGQAGIVLNLSSAPFNTVVGEILPCTASQSLCKWQMGNWGAGFAWTYPAVPTGEVIWSSGAPSGTNYSSPVADKLINDTIYSNSPTAMHRYDTYLSRDLPAIWQMCTYTVSEVSNKLHGVTFNPVGPITPEDWYLTK